jgi:hypothetical protein
MSHEIKNPEVEYLRPLKKLEDVAKILDGNYHYDYKNQKFALHDGDNTMLCSIPPTHPFILLILIQGVTPVAGLIHAYPTIELRQTKIDSLHADQEFWVCEIPFTQGIEAMVVN